MPDRPAETSSSIAALRARLDAAEPTLPTLFDVGEQLINADPGDVVGWPSQRLAVLGALTTDYITRAIACGLLLEGVRPIIYQAPFGSYVQEILDPSAPLYRFAPELAVIAPDWRDLVEPLPPGASPGEVDSAMDGKVALFRHIWGQLGRGGACRILQHSIVPPAAEYNGVAERLLPASVANQIHLLNERLFAAGRDVVTWIDVATLAEEVGTRRFAPAKFYHNARLPFDNRHLPLYLPLFRGAWRAACGRSKKLLALDLDNTLWGGVIGDDGVDGIVLGPATPVGEAFQAWQAYIAAMRARGIVLAACSKNDPEVAETGFTHPQTVLRRADFSDFACSWNDKVQGLRSIAANLNLGLDSFVFCDDNPAECDLVHRELPEVTVINLGNDPTRFIDLLDAGHWFEQSRYTGEDFARADMYHARTQALEAAQSAPDIGVYLSGLRMRGQVFRPEPGDMERFAQLEMKTNQFNITTRRYTPAALASFMNRPDAEVLAFRLSDRFGEHGLTSTLIALEEGDALRIDSWLMSCRIFSRSAEQFILRYLLDVARRRGVQRIIGEYRPTARNGVVADLFPRLGFSAISDPAFFVRAIDDKEAEDLLTSIIGA